MLRLMATSILIIFSILLSAQKKPLDHTVYDGWQHIGEPLISNNGNWVVYTIDPQQGDNNLVIQSADTTFKLIIHRGTDALITDDSRYVICKIKPFFKYIREAKIRTQKAGKPGKKTDEKPKDSIAIIELGKSEIWKTESVKNFKIPEKNAGFVAYQLEKKTDTASVLKQSESPAIKRIKDSLNYIIDSLENYIRSTTKKKTDDDDIDTDEINNNQETGTDLILRRLKTGVEITFENVLEYYFSKTGNKLLLEQAGNSKDVTGNKTVLLFDLDNLKSVLLSRGGNDFKNFTMTDDGSKVAYVAEREARPNDLQKFYRLWYYYEGSDSAILLADKFSAGMQLGYTISEFANLNFSKSGNRLFFGTAPIRPVRDTTLVSFEHPVLDIWHYNDDYLQSMQLTSTRLKTSLQQSFLAVYDFRDKTIRQLGSENIPQVVQTNEGDGDQFVGITDVGKRIELQWMGNTKKDIYAIHVKDGSQQLIMRDLQGVILPQYASPSGKYFMWYDSKARNYFVWNGKAIKNITDKIIFPVWNEEHDAPSDPSPYGIMGWQEGDSAVYIYDKYDIWKIDPENKKTAMNITETGRKLFNTYRYIKTDKEEKYLKNLQPVLLGYQNQITKNAGIAVGTLKREINLSVIDEGPYVFNSIVKAKEEPDYLFTKENFVHSPDLCLFKINTKAEIKLSAINPQQSNYIWGTAELCNWKAYNGKDATGIIYKPENFDPKKKYPMICYFYEKLSNNLNNYKEPAPIRSAINIPFFVSRGYIIFIPDIVYTTGHPGQNAYDYIVSGARAIVKKGWADSTKIAIQGHSWGGYQSAQLATMTNLFKAVWAGAPVANMTSAYGGIRWQSGMNRQFQYEKTQSRIGATLWQKPDLYIENSPLFHLDKVTAPVVIMANDADGAVPWYQGIELFTGLRRLGKKVWMFNYNGQGHGLTQRQDMLDYQIRMQQFFDWILKGEKPAQWIINGVPAVNKGKDWGLEIVD